MNEHPDTPLSPSGESPPVSEPPAAEPPAAEPVVAEPPVADHPMSGPASDSPAGPAPEAMTEPAPEASAATGEPPPPGGPGQPPPLAGLGQPPQDGPGGPGTPPPGGHGQSPPPGGPGQPEGGAGVPFAARYGLVRPLQGRYLGGVCAAFGRATNTDPVLWRVLLAVTSFFGIGIVVYLVGWLLIPAEGDTASPLEALLGRGRSRSSPVLVVVLGLAAVLVLGGMLTDGFRGPLLIVAVVVGAVLLFSRNSERARAAAAAGYPPPYTPTEPFPTTTAPYDPAYTPATPPTAPMAPVPPAAPYRPAAPAGWRSATTSPYAAAYRPAAGPYGAAYAAPTAPPGAQVSTGAAGTATPAAPPGYRPPFAPRGPYAGGAPTLPPQPPVAYQPPPPRPPKPPRERSRLGIFTLSLVVLALGAAGALDLSNAVNVGVGGYFAAMLAMVGLGLVVGAWLGRARWLIAVGLAFVVALGIASAAERIDPHTFGSDVVWQPTSVADLDTRYELNVGQAKLDLRQVDFTNQDKAVSVRVNAGDLEVLLPADVDTTVRTDMTAGSAQIFDKSWSGLNPPTQNVTDLGKDSVGGGKLQLTIRLNAGNVEVHR